jgi:hypothetical protein
MKIVKVTKNHKAEFNIPLIANKDEIVEGQERETEWEGWLWCRNSSGVHACVPKAYLKPASESGHYQFVQDYNARELTIDEGQEVIVLNEESGWAWVRTPLGDEGWIPLVNLQDLKNKPDSIPDIMQ